MDILFMSIYNRFLSIYKKFLNVQANSAKNGKVSKNIWLCIYKCQKPNIFVKKQHYRASQSQEKILAHLSSTN